MPGFLPEDCPNGNVNSKIRHYTEQKTPCLAKTAVKNATFAGTAKDQINDLRLIFKNVLLKPDDPKCYQASAFYDASLK